MIYRAEVLYSAKGDANKIFQNMSKYIFDYGEFERIQHCLNKGYLKSPYTMPPQARGVGNAIVGIKKK